MKKIINIVLSITIGLCFSSFIFADGFTDSEDEIGNLTYYTSYEEAVKIYNDILKKYGTDYFYGRDTDKWQVPILQKPAPLSSENKVIMNAPHNYGLAVIEETTNTHGKWYFITTFKASAGKEDLSDSIEQGKSNSSGYEIVRGWVLAEQVRAEPEQYQRLQTIETNGVSISLPRDINLWCGHRDTVLFKVENRTNQDKTVVIKAKTKVNIFLNGLTCAVDTEDIPFEVAEINIPALTTKEDNIEIQSLRVGKHNLKVIIEDKEATIVLYSKLKENGIYFMDSYDDPGKEFFSEVFSDGSKEISAQEKKREHKSLFNEYIQNGYSEREARKKADRGIMEKYKFKKFRKKDNWEKMYNGKKSQHMETKGLHYINLDGFGWEQIEYQKGVYDWTATDFLAKVLPQLYEGELFARIEIGSGGPPWAYFEKGPSGRYGFYDAQNKVLLDAYEKFCEALAERYDGDGKDDAPGSPIINHFTLNNEPGQYWLAVDFDEEGWPVFLGEFGFQSKCWKKGGNEEYKKVYEEMFGDILFEMTKRTSQAIKRANPEARLCSHQFCATEQVVFKYLLDKGIGKYVDAWGIHTYPHGKLLDLWDASVDPNRQWDFLTGGSAQGEMPPFESENFNTVKGRDGLLKPKEPLGRFKKNNPYMGKIWREIVDRPASLEGELEAHIKTFSDYNLDLPFWYTELGIGAISNRRENLIGILRQHSIVAHLKGGIYPIGWGYVKDVSMDIEKNLAGAISLEKFDCRWFVPEEERYLDYRWTVYKLFNRGNEDIIALWSNSAKDEIMAFIFNPEANIHNIRIVEYDADEKEFRQEKSLKEFPEAIKVKPLKEFYFISVISDNPKFGWLKDIRRKITPEEKEVVLLYNNTAAIVRQAKDMLRNQYERNSAVEKTRFIRDALQKADDAIIMGQYVEAKEILGRIQKIVANLKE